MCFYRIDHSHCYLDSSCWKKKELHHFWKFKHIYNLFENNPNTDSMVMFPYFLCWRKPEFRIFTDLKVCFNNNNPIPFLSFEHALAAVNDQLQLCLLCGSHNTDYNSNRPGTPSCTRRCPPLLTKVFNNNSFPHLNKLCKYSSHWLPWYSVILLIFKQTI